VWLSFIDAGGSFLVDVLPGVAGDRRRHGDGVHPRRSARRCRRPRRRTGPGRGIVNTSYQIGSALGSRR
jgi:hypothetical protein